MLRHAQKRAQTCAINFSGMRGRLENLDFIAGSPFDLINFYGVIEHLVDPLQVLSQLVRVLAPGGLLIVGVPRKGSMAWLTYALFHYSLEGFGAVLKRGPDGSFRVKRKMALYLFFRERDSRFIYHLKGVHVIPTVSPLPMEVFLGPPARILEKAANPGGMISLTDGTIWRKYAA